MGSLTVHMDSIDVLVIGRSCLDYIAVVERFPAENQKAPMISRLKEGGGQGGTAACCISKLDGNVAYVGRLGDDAEGQFCLKRLEAFGVDTDHIDIVSGGHTPVAYLFVTRTTGDRTIIYEKNELPKITASPELTDLAARSKTMLLDPEVTYLGRELRNIAGNDCRIVYDCERWRTGLEEMMAVADYFIPSADFLEAEELPIEGDAIVEKIRRLNEIVSGELIVTNGADGAYFFLNNQLRHVPAYPVEAVDTIGAGDNFHAAFALALNRGFDLEQCVKFSVVVASLSCREYGGRNGIPRWEEALAVAETLTVSVV
jgi:sulfofructose kinase